MHATVGTEHKSAFANLIAYMRPRPSTSPRKRRGDYSRTSRWSTRHGFGASFAASRTRRLNWAWCLLAAVMTAVASQGTAQAAIVNFYTPAGAELDDLPVNAEAEFVTGNGTITIKLINHQADPRSVIQCLSDLLFKVSDGDPNDATIGSSSGVERTVDPDKDGGGDYVPGGAVAMDWTLHVTGLRLHLDLLATPGQKAHTIIGPPNTGSGLYDDAKGSIAGNIPHNPFIGEEGNWVLNLPGVTSDSIISDVTFSYGTAAGVYIDGIPDQPVPEPGTLVLLGIGTLFMVRHVGRKRGWNFRIADGWRLLTKRKAAAAA